MENPYVLVYLLNVISSLTREFTHAMRHGEGVDYGKFAESKAPAALIPHSPASPSIVAYVAMGKVSLAMPYYRQECALFEFSDNEEEAGQLLPAEIGLMYCNKLFYLERTLKDLKPEERKQQSLELEQPVWEQFWNWLDTLHPSGGMWSQMFQKKEFPCRLRSRGIEGKRQPFTA